LTPHFFNKLKSNLLNLSVALFSYIGIDVFCEKGVYDVDQSRRILEAGRLAGLRLNFHAGWLNLHIIQKRLKKYFILSLCFR